MNKGNNKSKGNSNKRRTQSEGDAEQGSHPPEQIPNQNILMSLLKSVWKRGSQIHPQPQPYPQPQPQPSPQPQPQQYHQSSDEYQDQLRIFNLIQQIKLDKKKQKLEKDIEECCCGCKCLGLFKCLLVINDSIQQTYEKLQNKWYVNLIAEGVRDFLIAWLVSRLGLTDTSPQCSPQPPH